MILAKHYLLCYKIPLGLTFKKKKSVGPAHLFGQMIGLRHFNKAVLVVFPVSADFPLKNTN